MFRIQKGGDYRQTHNHNSAPAMLSLLGFLFVVGLVGGIAWAFMTAVQSVTGAMSRTWTAGNNDGVIFGFNTLVIVGGLVIISLITLSILPFVVRNWRDTLQGGSRGRDSDYNVLPGQGQPMLDVEPQPFGLLMDGGHEERFLDADYSEVQG